MMPSFQRAKSEGFNVDIYEWLSYDILFDMRWLSDYHFSRLNPREVRTPSKSAPCIFHSTLLTLLFYLLHYEFLGILGKCAFNVFLVPIILSFFLWGLLKLSPIIVQREMGRIQHIGDNILRIRITSYLRW